MSISKDPCLSLEAQVLKSVDSNEFEEKANVVGSELIGEASSET